MTLDDFEPWMSRWRLTPDGEPFLTLYQSRPSSRLAPVIHDGAPAMLKVPVSAEERLGARLMGWYGGHGAARVLAIDDEAILLERLVGSRSLAAMARGGEDEAATRILCGVAARLHEPGAAPPPASLVPLTVWFKALPIAAERHGGVLALAWSVAQTLLASPQDEVPLHGDLHHGNVLDGGARGWLAIDPKGLLGERGFDYANMVCNPDLATATAPGALIRRARIIAAAADFDMERYLNWVLAWAGLSAAWLLNDGDDAGGALTMAGLAAAELS